MRVEPGEGVDFFLNILSRHPFERPRVLTSSFSILVVILVFFGVGNLYLFSNII